MSANQRVLRIERGKRCLGGEIARASSHRKRAVRPSLSGSIVEFGVEARFSCLFSGRRGGDIQLATRPSRKRQGILHESIAELGEFLWPDAACESAERSADEVRTASNVISDITAQTIEWLGAGMGDPPDYESCAAACCSLRRSAAIHDWASAEIRACARRSRRRKRSRCCRGCGHHFFARARGFLVEALHHSSRNLGALLKSQIG